MSKYTLGIIGGGNMADAVVSGVIKFLPADKIIISDIDAEKLRRFAARGLCATCDNKLVAESSDYVLFAVKPQFSSAVFSEIAGFISSNRVISIMAGVKIAAIRSALGDVRVARVMPNTPCMLGKGMSALSFDGYDGGEKDFVLRIFQSLGETAEVDESKMDAVTSVSGSGPAYVYMFMQAMIEGGMDGGLTYDEARALAAQTLIGGAEMARTSDNLNTLIDAVCSKGGTTIQAVEHFRANNLVGIIKTGIEKCRKRSVELGKPATKKTDGGSVETGKPTLGKTEGGIAETDKKKVKKGKTAVSQAANHDSPSQDNGGLNRCGKEAGQFNAAFGGAAATLLQDENGLNRCGKEVGQFNAAGGKATDTLLQNGHGLNRVGKGAGRFGAAGLTAESAESVRSRGKKEVRIYTDGACSGNPGVGGWGAILIYNSDVREISGGERLSTNNRMELTAVLQALAMLKKSCRVTVYSDSAYVVRAVSESWIFGWSKSGWRTAGGDDVKNSDLWERLLAFLSVHEVSFVKVKGHSDNEYNNRCDKLAREAAAKVAASAKTSDA